MASLGFVSPATKRPAEGIYVMQMHVRIGWWWQLGLGWPELSPAMTLAVAGVRTRSAPMLGGTARRVRSATGSCECGGDDDVLRIDPTWLWPRRRRAVAAAGAAELGAVAVVLESENGKGEEEEELTGSAGGVEAGSGKARSRRRGRGDLGVRGGRRRGSRRCRAAGVAWLCVDDEDDPAVLLGGSARRGELGGHGYGKRRRRRRSGKRGGGSQRRG